MKIKGVVYQGKHTPIIDLETFNRVQKCLMTVNQEVTI